ncbi:MAG TPA: hypothetical protein VI094_01155 [Propionibacteriaceae bacterium]
MQDRLKFDRYRIERTSQCDDHLAPAISLDQCPSVPDIVAAITRTFTSAAMELARIKAGDRPYPADDLLLTIFCTERDGVEQTSSLL